MYNLPTDSSIQGCSLYHEGNHDNRENPHDQYINKFKTYKIETKSTGKNNYYNIASITWTPNSNVSLDYNIKMFDMPRSSDDLYNKSHELRIIINNSGIRINHKGANRFDVFATTSTSTNGDVSYNVYIKPWLDWQVFNYFLEFSRGSDYSGYTEDYAYRHITLCSSDFVASIGTTTGTITKDRPSVKTTATTTLQTVTASSGYCYDVNVPGITSTCNFSVRPNVSIPGEFLYSSSIHTNDYIYINFKNFATYNKDIPAITWYISYTPTT